MAAVQMGEHRRQRQVPAETAALAFHLAAVGGSGQIVGQIDQIGRGIRRAVCAAQLGGVMPAHTVQHRLPAIPFQAGLQKRIALPAVAAAFAARPVHRLAAVVQQPAQRGLQGAFLQRINSFV